MLAKPTKEYAKANPRYNKARSLIGAKSGSSRPNAPPTKLHKWMEKLEKKEIVAADYSA